MGYPEVIGFPRARDALAAWCEITGEKIRIPTNCCSALLPFASELVPIDPETGLAPVPVQIYGYRQEFPDAKLEIDPLMTGLLGQPFAESTIVSFGYAKTIDIGGGGAILTSNKYLADELREFGFFPPILYQPLQHALENIHDTIMMKKWDYEEIENQYGHFVDRLPTRPVLPWRFVARIKPGVENTLTDAWARGFKASKNYPPLPGVTDPGAVEWGRKVINIWK
jgi:hypothetical protein